MILKELSVAKNCLRPEIAPLRSVIGFHFLQHIMIGSWSLEEEKIIKDIRDFFRLKEELNYTPIKDIRNLFRQEKETKTVKDRRVSSQVISSQQKLVSFGVTIILNIKIMVIEIKHYQLKNILIKLDHIYMKIWYIKKFQKIWDLKNSINNSK